MAAGFHSILTEKVRRKSGGWLHIPACTIMIGSLLVGLELELWNQHLSSAMWFLAGGLLWRGAFGMLKTSTQQSRMLSRALPVFCASCAAFAGITELIWGYWDWLPAYVVLLSGILLYTSFERDEKGKLDLLR